MRKALFSVTLLIAGTVLGADPKLGDTKTVELGHGVVMELVWIPPGTFTMGSETAENRGETDEMPPHQVTISKGFWMGKYEVTLEQYRAVSEDEAGSDEDWYRLTRKEYLKIKDKNPEQLVDFKDPVDNVSYEMVVVFCQKLSIQAGETFRIPTEAEWEYACRAGTTTRFHSGDSDLELKRVGWFRQNSERKAHPVGQKQPNAWGLYDMHGGVWEWCADWYGPYPDGPVTDPTGPVSGKQKVLRGGSRYYNAVYCRSANRLSHHMSFRHDGSGFRVVMQH